MRKLLFYLIIIILSCESVLSQDSIVNKNLKFYSTIKFTQIYINTPFSKNKVIDPRIEIVRRLDTSTFYSPLMHSSSYFEYGINLNYKGKYNLDFHTVFEQRNWSIGKFNKNFIFIYPIVNLSYNNKFTISGKQNIFYTLKFGDFYSNSESEFGLRAYNLDIQGASGLIKYNKDLFSVLYATDLSENVGLLTDEYIFIKYLRELYQNDEKHLKYGVTSTILSRIISRYPSDNDNEFSVGVFLGQKLNNSFSYNLISDYRKPSLIATKGISNLGLTLTLDYCYLGKNVSINSKLKFRFFGEGYYEGFYERNYPNGFSKYRYRNDSIAYFEGNIVYPIRNYFRPVSQFGVYSEYLQANDLYAIEYNFSITQKLLKKINHESKIETVSIFHNDVYSKSKVFTYVFYSTFIYKELIPKLEFGIYITNKQMNRDMQYMGFYQMKYPFVGVHLKYKVNLH